MKKFDVITFGSAVVDIFMNPALKERKKNLLLPIGSKHVIKEINFSVGGGGTNSAVAFSKLGLKTGFVGKIGKGKNGEIILRSLKQNDVEFLGLESNDHTGYSVIIDSRKHDRTILTYKGANNTLSFNEIKLDKLNSRWFYFSSLMDKSFETQKRIIEYAEKRNIKIAFNPSEYQIKLGKNKLKEILNKTEILILNKEEAEMLVGKKEIFNKIHKLGPKIVCITDSQRGSEASDGVYLYKAIAHKGIKCVESTGAGDAYSAGFVYGIISGKTIKESMELGTLNAESVITKKGAKNGLLNLNELIKIKKTNPVKIYERLI